MIQIQALGGLIVTSNGQEVAVGGPRQRRLLALLLVHRNVVVSVDRLADLMFDGEPSAAAATTLRSYVARIRRVLGDAPASARLVTQAPGYVLHVPAESFDVTQFEEMLGRARRDVSSGDSSRAATELRSALSMWRGQAFAEFADEDWARPEVHRLAELRLVAHELLFDAELAAGRAADVVPEVEALVEEHPLREGFCAQLMIALYRSGRHADSLRVLRTHRERMLDELGLDPSPALGELERRILTHDPSLVLVSPEEQSLRGYRLGERLGTGSDGTVHAARLPGVEREVAIRVIRSDIADHPDFIRSFDSAARRVASITHPAIVPIYDYWREPGGAYVVVRRLHGGTLADRLERGPMAPAELSVLVARIGGALAAAADAGVVHGRVDSANVLYDDRGQPCLTDFTLVDVDRTLAARDDLDAFAALVRTCVPHARGAIDTTLHRATATVDTPTIGELTASLLEALDTTDRQDDTELPNPYKGLQAFDEADAADFFGRSDTVDAMLDRLGGDGVEARLLMVVGGSGTGKSSLVRAGLLPRIRRGDATGSDRWFVTTMLPGASPFKELAESLRRVAALDGTCSADELASGKEGIDRGVRRIVPDGGDLLLVIDQFEELFTMTGERERRAFLDGLLHAVQAPDSRLRLVTTLRADFYDRPLSVQGFGGAVNDATMTIAAMSPADIEAAIVEPAERVGRKVERALVAELVAAVSEEPAALPALQFVLFEVAERCGQTLSLSAAHEIGGVNGAIAARAEVLFGAHTEDEQVVLRQLFERLVVVAPEGDSTRRRATRDELTDRGTDALADAAIDRWADARLLSLDRDPHSRRPTVELAHEAMLHEWPRLRAWIDQDRELLTVFGHVREAANGWMALDRDPGALYRGARLEAAIDVVDRHRAEMSSSALEFVDASRDLRDREAADAAAGADRQTRANRRLRVQRVALALALVAAIVVGFVAIDQRRTADRERRVATARKLAAASSASLSDDSERSMLLALAAIETTRAADAMVLPEAVEALHHAVTRSRLVLSVPGLGGAVDWSPDGSIFVTEGPEESGTIDIRDATTGESVRVFQGHEVDINEVAFAATGPMLATSGDDGALRVWNASTGALTFEFVDPSEAGVGGPSFSADGTTVAASWIGAGVIRVFDLRTGELTLQIERSSVKTTALDAWGERLAYSQTDFPRAGVIDVASAAELFTVGRDELWIQDVAFSPAGDSIATSGGDGVARVWDSTTGKELVSLVGHTGPVNAIDWSTDGTRLATASDDGTARVWELDSGQAHEIVSVSADDTRNGLSDVAFSPNGDQLLTGDWALAAAKIWDVRELGGAEWANVPSLVSNRIPVDFTADGEIVASSGAGVTLWDSTTGALVRTIGQPMSTPGEQPDDPASAEAAIVATITALYDPAVPLPDELELVDDPTGIADAVRTVLQNNVRAELDSVWIEVRSVEFATPESALITYDIGTSAGAAGGRRGAATLINGAWLISRSTVCQDLELLGGDCGDSDASQEPQGPQADVIEFAVNKAEGLVATSTGNLPIDVWDMTTGRRHFSIEPETGAGSVIDLDWSADGRHLAITIGATDSCPVVVVDVTGAEVGRVHPTVDACVRTARFSPDGTQLVITRWPSRPDPEREGAEIWNWSTGELLVTLPPSASNAVFDPSGRLVATTRGLEGTTKVWDATTGAQVATMTSGAPSEHLAFSPDGTQLATAGLDGVVGLWDPQTGELMMALDANGVAISAVAFSPDGRQLASLGYDGIVRVWALDLDDLIAIAHDRLTRTLTDDECRQYLHMDRCTTT